MSSSPVKSTSPVATGEMLKAAESVVEGANCAAGDSQQKCASNDIDDSKKAADCAPAAPADKASAAKPAAPSTAVGTAKAGIAKSGDHPVPEFIPAPPPATNAWTARMQAAAPTAIKTESTSKPDTVAPKASSTAATKAPPPKANTSSAQPSGSKPGSPPAGKPMAAGTPAAPGTAKLAAGDAKKDEKPKNLATDKKPAVRKEAETSDAKKAVDAKKSDVKTETKKPAAAATANSSPPDPSKPTDTVTTTPTVIPAPIPVTSPWGNVSQTPVTSPWANTPAASTTVQSSVAASSGGGGGAWGAVGAKQMKPSAVQRVDKAEQTSELDAVKPVVKPAAESSVKNAESKPTESTRSECRSVEVSVTAAISHIKSSDDHKTMSATTTAATTTTTTSTSASDATTATTATTASGHVTRSEEARRWEKNASSSSRPSKAKDDQPAKSANLNDSADWPSLNKQPHKEGEAMSPVSAESLSPTAETADQPTAAVAVETAEQTNTAALSNHIKPSSDSDDTKDVGLTGQANKKKTKGSKQKWSPLEIEIPKPRRRRGTGRPRTDSREYPETGGRDSREGVESSHEVREGREGGRGGGRRPPRGGRESHESGGAGGARRSRSDRPPRRQSESEVDNSANVDQSERLRETTASSSRAATGPTSSRGWNNNTSSPSAANRSPLVNNTSPGPVGAPVPGRMGYQGSRRAMNRGGRGGYGTQPRGAGNRYPQTMWTTAGPPAYSYISFGGPDLTQFCYQVEQSPPTYFTPIVSQSDYYTSVLADEAAKKLIAQQIEYYFSVENLMKDFFLRRQMDSDGWIAVDLLASFRRVRIHTGAVNVQLILDSMAGSKVVEISADQKHMRTRFEPLKWSLQGVEPTSFSRLNAEVAEFVPGRPFKLPSPSLTSPSLTSPSLPTQSASLGDKATEDKISPAETNSLPTEDKTYSNTSPPAKDSVSAPTTNNLQSDQDERSAPLEPTDTSQTTQEPLAADSPAGLHHPHPAGVPAAAATVEQTSDDDDDVISAVTNTDSAAGDAESSLPRDEEQSAGGRDADD